MNWLKKGPEFKLSELKVPDFLYDLFYDLKERHLLPLVALLLVAMVAAPIYFKNSTKSEPEAATVPGPAATGSAVAAGGETLVVARSEPGLRDYRRRLKRYRALDPFRERGQKQTANPEVTNSSPSGSPEASVPTAPPAVEAPAEATVIGGEFKESPEAPAVPVEIPSAPESSPVPTESTGSADGKAEPRYASDSIDVRIVTVPHSSAEQAKTKKPKPQVAVRRNLPELTMLPARRSPAATYMGLSNDGKKALFVISSDVVSLFGEGKCVIGSQSCQLLMLEPGLPETFVYGPQEHTFRIELLKIDQTYASKPRRATLGSSKDKQPQGAGESEGKVEGTEGSGPSGKEPAER